MNTTPITSSITLTPLPTTTSNGTEYTLLNTTAECQNSTSDDYTTVETALIVTASSLTR